MPRGVPCSRTPGLEDFLSSGVFGGRGWRVSLCFEPRDDRKKLVYCREGSKEKGARTSDNEEIGVEDRRLRRGARDRSTSQAAWVLDL